MATDQSKKVTKSQEISKIDVGEEAMKKQNDVAIFLAGKVSSRMATNSNFVFSPTSITAVLTMVSATTEDEPLRSFILSLLRSSSTDELNAVFSKIATFVLEDGCADGGPKISSVNGVWVEQSLPFDHSSKDLIENFFKASYNLVDFRSKPEEVRKEVNSWALRHTNGLIKELIPPGSITESTVKIHGNALYFKGAWEESFEFDKSMTRDKPFHLHNGESVTVPFMSSYANQYVEAYDGFKVLKLPYQQSQSHDRKFSMYLYLPDNNKGRGWLRWNTPKSGLDHLVERMISTDGFLDTHIPQWRVKLGQFRIPKFKIEFGFEVTKAFPELLLDVTIRHKAMIEVDEEGTEAAAATEEDEDLGFSLWESSPPKLIDFVADHPFFFLIREDITGTILFAGQIFDPLKSEPSSP